MGARALCSHCSGAFRACEFSALIERDLASDNLGKVAQTKSKSVIHTAFPRSCLSFLRIYFIYALGYFITVDFNCQESRVHILS